MQHDAASVAPPIERQIRERIGDRQYQQFFKQGARFETQGDDLVVFVGSPYLQSWLQRQFQRDLTDVAHAVVGPGARLRLEVDPTLAIRLPADNECRDGSDLQNTASPTGSGGVAPRKAAPRRRFADFAQFVTGTCNDLAATAARRVAESPDGQFNPLFLHGGVGCGKTHLLEAVYRHVRQQHPNLQVLYLTAENFTNSFTQSLRERTLPSFHQRFRGVDVLLIDDVDFLDGKRGLQEEFLHTVRTLEGLQRQMVFSADRHPRLLSKSSDELVTRYLSGMVCRIEPPDVQTRQELVRRRAKQLDLQAADDALRLVADRFPNNVRELEGAVNCLHAWQAMTGQSISRRMAREVLARLERDCIRVVRLGDIEEAVSKFFGVACDDLRSALRGRSVSQPRNARHVPVTTSHAVCVQ